MNSAKAPIALLPPPTQAITVNVVACSMSMDLMGIKKEEFIEGVEIGGVASYLGATEDSGLNLFI